MFSKYNNLARGKMYKIMIFYWVIIFLSVMVFALMLFVVEPLIVHNEHDYNDDNDNPEFNA